MRKEKNTAAYTGMECPQCQGMDSQVIDSCPKAQYVRRRRECRACGARWTTYEYPLDTVEQVRRELAKYRLIGQILDGLFHGG